MVWFCDGLAFIGTVVFEALHAHRAALAVDVLLSMLAREALEAASSGASMSLLCSASMSRRLVFASKLISLILLMYPAYSISWARFWIGVVILPRRISMVWILLRRLLLRPARVDMLVSGAGLVIDRAVSGFWG